ncbi:MAG: hypothetical protein ABH862_00180 [Candidatus Omnitrophota bacterium]
METIEKFCDKTNRTVLMLCSVATDDADSLNPKDTYKDCLSQDDQCKEKNCPLFQNFYLNEDPE